MADDKLFYRIEVQDDGSLKIVNFGRAIRDTGDDIDRSTGRFHKLHTTLGLFDGSIGKVFRSLFSLKALIVETAMALGLWKIERTIERWMKLSQTQEAAEIQFRQAMITAGKYSEESYKNILRQSEAFQTLGVATDEAILQGMKYLITYKEITDDLMPRATKAMLDYAAFTGRDMEMSAKAVGKAAIGMIGELRRVGIQIGENTFKTHGFIGVLKELEEQIGKQADALSKTSKGQWIAFGAAVLGVKEKIGDFFNAIFTHTGLLNEMTESVWNINTSLKEFKDSGQLDLWALETAKVVIEAFQWMVSAIDIFYTKIKDLKTIIESIADNKFIKLLYETSPISSIINYDKTLKEFDDFTKKIKQKYHELMASMLDVMASAYPEYAEYHRKALKALETPITSITEQKNKLDNFQILLDKIQKKLDDIKNNIKLPNLDEVVVIGEKQNEIIEKFKKDWENLGNGISDVFRNTFRDILTEGKIDFKNLGESIKGVFADVAADIAKREWITPFMDKIIGKASGSVATASALSKFAPMFGMGAVGYGLGGNIGGLAGLGYGLGSQFLSPMFQGAVGATGPMQAGALSGLGLPAGLGGPLGMLAGIAIGTVADSLLKEKPEMPQIDLLFDVIDGKVKLIGEHWSRSSRSQELINQIEETLQSQIDFYDRIMTLTNNAAANFAIGLTGHTGFDIQKGLQENPFQLLSRGYTAFASMSPEFAKNFAETWAKTISDATQWMKTGRQGIANYGPGLSMPPAEMLAQIQAGNTENFDAWLSQQIYAAVPGYGKTKKEPFWKLLADVGNMGEWDKLFESISEKFYAIQSDFANAIGNAFLEATNTPGMQGFEENVKKLLYENIKTGIAQGFTIKMLDTLMMSNTGMVNAFGLLQAYASGVEGVTEDQVMNALDQAMGGLTENIDKMDPLLTKLTDWLMKMHDALGINTDALSSNTEALLGPIEAFLQEMRVGSLAPVQSLAGMEAERKSLYEKAILNPSSARDFLSYLEQTYLPWQMGSSEDYAGVAGSIYKDVEGLPAIWGISSGSSTSSSSAREIGAEVARAIAGVQSNKPVTINIIVDGEIIKQKVIESLEDYEVVQAVRNI